MKKPILEPNQHYFIVISQDRVSFFGEKHDKAMDLIAQSKGLSIFNCSFLFPPFTILLILLYFFLFFLQYIQSQIRTLEGTIRKCWMLVRPCVNLELSKLLQLSTNVHEYETCICWISWILCFTCNKFFLEFWGLLSLYTLLLHLSLVNSFCYYVQLNILYFLSLEND